jgi:molecular chaperone GrpE (heat shock protein)
MRFTFPRFITSAERERLARFDLLESNLSGTRHALETQQRALDDANNQIDTLKEQITKLQQEYAQQAGRQSSAASHGTDAIYIDIFRRLQSIAVQLPTIRASAASGAQIGASDVLGVVAPLETMLRDLGFEPIGEANQVVSFDPRLHQLTGPSGSDIAEGDEVKVRFVGYRFRDQIVCRAEVTRLESVVSV